MISTVAALGQRVIENVGRVIIGKDAVTELILVALLCEGHVLIEDVPGVGKTTLARAVARSIGGQFRRIQFTPDLLPSDITGLTFFNQRTGEFQFRAGPVFTNVLLADEINRATPRTQSALLEAMQERTVTIEGETIPLPRPFLVLATENPVEIEGTFPLPEAQLDRFLLRIVIGYPEPAEEVAMLARFQERNPLDELEPVTTPEELLRAAAACRSIYVEDDLRWYIAEIARATRRHEAIELGVSPRGTLALFHCAQALAAIRGRDFVLPDDVKELVTPVLAHRIILSPEARLRGRDARQLLEEIVETVNVPVEQL
ncbi:MoxR family ATPase [Thermomicrobiaceae bacterium CFH 74404]|uniref:MoxR family ATPase n=1 Tax=Thermalbibacter longus TaxID=2951981 RepID=A0AA41WE37_9BACT|nr:MoxR family ATPase [Thermalbibacter longus]MCM8747771.1 MoxR family ATPase [Thermalbibacter longus]